MTDSTTTTVGPVAPRGRSSRGQHHGPSSGQGRGRGGRNRGQRGGTREGRAAMTDSADGNRREPPGSPPKGDFGARLTKAASQIQGDLGVQDGQGQAKMTDQEGTDGEVCFICASTIEHTSISPCNHQTCHICALRLRALYKTKACAHCRTDAEYVIFTDSTDKRYEDFADQPFVNVDDNLGVKFENSTILDDTILLLRYNCPDKDCDIQCLSWPDLHRHVRGKHGKIMCHLCTRNKKVFTHEHELFTYGELRRHERFGDDNPGAVDQSGFKGHPECGFCKQRFYGDDELYTHCRERHERCHICDRRNHGSHPQYYLNYQELEKHFQQVHYVCLDAECQANKTNVFESEIDLKAHQLSEHPQGLSKDARRDARLVDLAGFDIRASYQPERRSGRQDRPGRQGRDPNADPLPVSSAQPIGRAELAYQRQMALSNAQTSSGRTFGGQLTQESASPRPQSQPLARDASQSPATIQPPNLNTLTLSDRTPSAPAQPLTPQEQARTARHAAVISRATSLFPAPTSTSAHATKLQQFRTLISHYHTSTLTAPQLLDQLIETLFPIPPTPVNDLGKLIRELADLFESEPKRQSLLEAWHNWRSINDASDYPSLPGVAASSTLSSGSGALGGRKILKIKSSTTKSGRSAVNRQGAWNGQALPGSNMSGNPFPSLPSTSGGHHRAKTINTTFSGGDAAWGAKPPPSSSATAQANPMSSSSSRLNNSSSTNHRSTETITRNEEYPSLPYAAKPSVLMAGLTRGTVRWDGSRSSNPSPGAATPVPSAWNSSNGPTPAQASATLDAMATVEPVASSGDVDDGRTGGTKKKGKKKEKQVLYHFG